MTVDYSQREKKASDVYEVNSSEAPVSESFDEYDELMANLNWLRFAMVLFTLPVATFVAFAAGFEQKRTDFLYLGALLLALSILVIVLALKFYKGKPSWSEKERRESLPRFHRRI